MENEVIDLSTNDYPQKLKQVRLKRSLTQSALAKKAGISQQTVSAIEKGRLDPSLKILMLLAGILGVTLLIRAFSKKGGE